MPDNLDIQTILNALGHGVLIFSDTGALLQYNLMAGKILGADLNVIKSDGWESAIGLFDGGVVESAGGLDEIREQAMHTNRPVRFHMLRSGEYVPCWASMLTGTDGKLYTMLTLDVTDWEIVSNVIDSFRDEMRETVLSTAGHVTLIEKILGDAEEDTDEGELARRISGFSRLIAIHMNRTTRLMQMLHRMQDLRTGTINTHVRDERRRVTFQTFLEDFIESLSEIDWLDPETDTHDFRARFVVKVPEENVDILAAPRYLTYTLQELLRNAIMYSMLGTSINIVAMVKEQSQSLQVDIADSGYGIRASEWDRVFTPFQRARQPQIMGEFGYGLNLYLCKHEIQAMNGRLWFATEETVGTTFSFTVPLWREESSPSPSGKPFI